MSEKLFNHIRREAMRVRPRPRWEGGGGCGEREREKQTEKQTDIQKHSPWMLGVSSTGTGSSQDERCVCVSVCVCVRACVRACACLRAFVRACVRVSVSCRIPVCYCAILSARSGGILSTLCPRRGAMQDWPSVEESCTSWEALPSPWAVPPSAVWPPSSDMRNWRTGVS